MRWMVESTARVMVVMAHPDDAEFSAGGTVAQWVSEGREVIYVVCTDGDRGSNDPTMTPEQLALIRRREQQQAADTLGVRQVIFLGHPDCGLEDTPGFRGELVRLIRVHRPELVVVNDPNRLYSAYVSHRDHRMVATVTLDAVFPAAGLHLYYPEHLTQGLLPHRVREVYLSGTDSPNTWVDVSDTFERKLAALRCHISQVAHWWDEVQELMRQMAARMGEMRGLPLAEAFRRVELPWWSR